MNAKIIYSDPPQFFVDDRCVSEAEFQRLMPSKLDEVIGSGQTGLGQSSAGWPRQSLSMGVHPSQRGEATEHARKIGVPTEFAANGKAIFTDPGHQKRYAKAMNYVDLCERNNTSRVES